MNYNFKMQYIFFLISIATSQLLYAQETMGARNTVYYELGGTVLGPASLNYERIIPITKSIKFSPGIGIGISRISYRDGTGGVNEFLVKFPVQTNLLIGKAAHNLELGFGMPLDFDRLKQKLYAGILVLRLGYRYQPLKKGLMVRASINPGVIMFYPTFTVGLGIGYAF